MKTFRLALVLLALFASSFELIEAVMWQPAKDYVIKFESNSATGTISGLKGDIAFDDKHLDRSYFDVMVDVNTLNTGNKLKDKHAKGKKFFNVAQYPSIRYTTSGIDKTATGYLATGKLTIKEVTRTVVIPFTFENTDDGGVFKGRFMLNRKDYNLRRFAVSKMITVDINIPVSPKI